MRALKDRGQFVGDREVIEALLRKLLEPEYQTGVVVDGFPRTQGPGRGRQAAARPDHAAARAYWGTPTGKRFRRPIFRITVLFVGEQTSVERQLSRGREILAHNEQVRRTGVGALIELRAHRRRRSPGAQPLPHVQGADVRRPDQPAAPLPLSLRQRRRAAGRGREEHQRRVPVPELARAGTGHLRHHPPHPRSCPR